MDTSQKISMDTQNDGLEKESPLKYGQFEHLCSISRELLMIIPFQTNQPFASVFKAPSQRRSPSDPCDVWDCNYVGFPPFHNNLAKTNVSHLNNKKLTFYQVYLLT